MNLDEFIKTSDIMARFGITRDRVSKIARARKWQCIQIGTANLYRLEDVEAEAERRKEKGLKG